MYPSCFDPNNKKCLKFDISCELDKVSRNGLLFTEVLSVRNNCWIEGEFWMDWYIDNPDSKREFPFIANERCGEDSERYKCNFER